MELHSLQLRKSEDGRCSLLSLLEYSRSGRLASSMINCSSPIQSSLHSLEIINKLRHFLLDRTVYISVDTYIKRRYVRKTQCQSWRCFKNAEINWDIVDFVQRTTRLQCGLQRIGSDGQPMLISHHSCKLARADLLKTGIGYFALLVGGNSGQLVWLREKLAASLRGKSETHGIATKKRSLQVWDNALQFGPENW